MRSSARSRSRRTLHLAPQRLLALRRERPVGVAAPPLRPALRLAVPQEVDLHQACSLSSTACSRARATNHSCALSDSSPSTGQTCVQLPSAAEHAGLHVVVHVHRQDLVADAAQDALVLHREQDLDPTVEVARHEVGAAEDDLVVAAVAEPVDAAVLEEPAHHALLGDVLAHPGHARPQAAHAAHHELDLHAGLRRAVQLADHRLVDQRVHLEDEVRRRVRPRRGRSRGRCGSAMPWRMLTGATSSLRYSTAWPPPVR